MTYRIAYWDNEAGEQRERDATAEEAAEIESRLNAEPIPLPRHVTKLAFRNRFTMAEKTLIEMAKVDDPSAPIEQRQQAASVRVYLSDLNAATYIDLERPDTRAGVALMESSGLIADGRAVQILDAEITPEEQYRPI